eukprot:5356551-Prymnesium_polylepis.1
MALRDQHGPRWRATGVQGVFLLNYPIGSKTLGQLKARIIDGRTMAHAKREEGGASHDSGFKTQ